MNAKVLFFMLVILSIMVSFIDIIARPFEWVETFFHELSHGIMAVLTGGKIINIELNWNGSGSCTSLGGWPVFVSFAGYLGAQVAGFCIYLAGAGGSIRFNRVFSLVTALVIVTTMVLFVRDFESAFILMVLVLLFALPALKLKHWLLSYFIRFMGIYVLISSMFSPVYQLGSSRSDAASLASMTLIPSFVWVTVWCCTGFAVLLYLLKRHVR